MKAITQQVSTRPLGGTFEQVRERLTKEFHPVLMALRELLNRVVAAPEQRDAVSGTALTLDWSSYVFRAVTLTDNCAFTFTAPPGGCLLVLRLTQDAIGSRTVSWLGPVLFASGTPPVLTATGGAVDLIGFYSDGTSFYGFSLGADFTL